MSYPWLLFLGKNGGSIDGEESLLKKKLGQPRVISLARVPYGYRVFTLQATPLAAQPMAACDL